MSGEVYAKYDKSIKGKYRKLKIAAKSVAQGFNINFEQFVKIQASDCFYCGGELSKTGHGIDRIDSSKGYKLGNVRPCCTDCNRAKGDMSESKFLKHIMRIVRNLQLK